MVNFSPLVRACQKKNHPFLFRFIKIQPRFESQNQYIVEQTGSLDY